MDPSNKFDSDECLGMIKVFYAARNSIYVVMLISVFDFIKCAVT